MSIRGIEAGKVLHFVVFRVGGDPGVQPFGVDILRIADGVVKGVQDQRRGFAGHIQFKFWSLRIVYNPTARMRLNIAVEKAESGSGQFHKLTVLNGFFQR